MEKVEIHQVVELDGKWYRLVPLIEARAPATPKQPQVTKTKTKKLKPNRIAPQDVFQRSEKYSTNVSKQEVENVLSHLDNEVSTTELMKMTKLSYYRALAILDVLLANNRIVKADNGLNTIYRKVL